MKYLVLGSAGQIGAALVSKIRQSPGDSVLEFDIENGTEQDLRIYKNELLDALVEEADFVFFLAFDVGGSRYLAAYQNTYDFISNNIKIMDQTFDVLKKHNKPFIFASTQMANMSHSSYGILKSIGEKTSAVLGGIVVKLWNVHGLEHDEDKFHVITDLIVKAASTKKINLLTDGTEERQFLYADDCCDCLIELSIRYKDIDRNKQLHVASFEWTNILDVANYIASHFPGSVVIPSALKDEVQKNQRNEPDTYILELWKPKIGLNESISYIIKEMLSSPHKYPGMPLK